MNELEKLIQNRAKLVATARAFLDEHTKDGTMSAEDSAAYDKIEADINECEKAIDREKRLCGIENTLKQPTSAPLVSQPDNGSKNLKRTATDEYKQAFTSALRTGFKQVSNVLSEGIDSSGGYLVPEILDKDIVKGLDEANAIRSIASGQYKINVAATRPEVTWTTENAQIGETSATWSQVEYDSYKLAAILRISNELMADNAFDLARYIVDEFVLGIASGEEEAFCVGTGIGQPTGIFNATGGGQVGVTTTNATSITGDNLIDLVYSLGRPYRRAAKFVLNDGTIANIRKLKDSSGQFLWQPSYTAGEPDTLLGYPVITSAYAPKVEAAANVIAFGDFKYYKIVDREARSVKMYTERYMEYDQTAFRAIERVDGKIVLPEAIKLLKMGGTV